MHGWMNTLSIFACISGVASVGSRISFRSLASLLTALSLPSAINWSSVEIHNFGVWSIIIYIRCLRCNCIYKSLEDCLLVLQAHNVWIRIQGSSHRKNKECWYTNTPSTRDKGFGFEGTIEIDAVCKLIMLEYSHRLYVIVISLLYLWYSQLYSNWAEGLRQSQS